MKEIATYVAPPGRWGGAETVGGARCHVGGRELVVRGPLTTLEPLAGVLLDTGMGATTAPSSCIEALSMYWAYHD